VEDDGGLRHPAVGVPVRQLVKGILPPEKSKQWRCGRAFYATAQRLFQNLNQIERNLAQESF
jgi:hypothetical protein